MISFSGNVAVEVEPTLDRERLDEGIEDLELAESTAIGDALATGTNLLTRTAGDDDAPTTSPRAPSCSRPTARRRSGATRRRGPSEAADAGVPVSPSPSAPPTDDPRPVSGQQLPVPVQPAPLEEVAETTGGAAYEAATATELTTPTSGSRTASARRSARRSSGSREPTWQWAAIALTLIAAAWALAMWWLRGMV